jgi:sugar phosphate permease
VFVWLWGVADSPRQAKWISEAERTALTEKIDAEEAAMAARTSGLTAATFRSQITRAPVLIFTASILLWNIGFLGFVIWLPSVIHQQPNLSSADIGWLSAIPYACAIVVMQGLTYWSDRTQNRRLFSAGPLAISGVALIVGGIGLVGSGFTINMALLVVAGAMLYGSQPVLWSIATEILPASVTGSVSGAINAVGVVGAFVGPYLVGYVRAVTQSFSAGLLVMGLALMGTSILVMLIRTGATRSMTTSPAST